MYVCVCVCPNAVNQNTIKARDIGFTAKITGQNIGQVSFRLITTKNCYVEKTEFPRKKFLSNLKKKTKKLKTEEKFCDFFVFEHQANHILMDAFSDICLQFKLFNSPSVAFKELFIFLIRKRQEQMSPCPLKNWVKK